MQYPPQHHPVYSSWRRIYLRDLQSQNAVMACRASRSTPADRWTPDVRSMHAARAHLPARHSKNSGDPRLPVMQPPRRALKM